tara:strand:- start:48 stop:896 length:849 start_codon:yes stop_codon:yes gene_type:complete
MNIPVRNDPRTEYKNTDVKVKTDISGFKEFDYRHLPKDGFFISIISARRGGKSFLVNYLIQLFQKNKELRFTHIFLISSTGFGFKGIPPNYRFDNMRGLDYIMNNQDEIRKYNQTAKEHKRMKSRILVVIDDMAYNQNKDEGMKNEKLVYMALNGRHFSTKDPVPNNGISIILISQALKKIPKAVRLNQDVMFANNISSLIERYDLLDENFYIDTTIEGKKHGRKVYEELSKKEDFVFIVIENHIQNKRKLEDYIRFFKAKELRHFKFFGNKKDWYGVEPFD